MTERTEMSDLSERIIDVCQRFNLVTLYVFGSQGSPIFDSIRKGTSLSLTEGHDVDVGVKAHRNFPLSVKQKVELTIELEDLLDAPRVDLISLDDADPFLAANIIRGERIYAADDYVADEYELYILRRAGDLAPFEKERINRILGADSS